MTTNLNLPVLVDAICEAYDNPDFHMVVVPDDPLTVENEYRKITYCNLAVNYVAQRMGFNGFKGLLANSMIDLMDKSDAWQNIRSDDAARYANMGGLVVAGLKNKPHGHVVIVRPGLTIYSTKYGQYVPKCLQIGATRFLGLTNGTVAGVNWAFAEMPYFYWWVGA